jgi:cytochrome c
MKKHVVTVLATALLASAPLFAAPAVSEHGTEAEAQEMVKKAVALIKAEGDAAYRTFTEHPGGAFKDRDMYIWVYDFDGKNLAHGFNPKMVGKLMPDLKDVDGKEIIKDQIALVKTKGSGWYGPFKFSNPVTKKIETKRAFCMRGAGDTMVCSGIYSDQ